MFLLTVAACVVLGAALAKPPPSDKSRGLAPDPRPYNVEPVPYQGYGKPQPIEFQGLRNTYTLAPGRYYFTSPNYPNNYPNNYDTSFTVIGNNNQAITITCNPFRMERHSTCRYDFLAINGRKYCGTNIPPTTIVSELRIRIKTDSSVTTTGFYCLVTIATTSATTTTTTSAPPTGGCNCGQMQTRVVGGSDAAAGQFAWQAGLVQPGGTRTFCGGSVINSRYVLTAAHCTVGSAASQIQVLLGDLRIAISDAGEQRFSVQRIINHPSYTSASGSGWDFSLLRLASQITFSSTIQPVCLPTAGQTYAGATAIASGYGRLGATLPQANTLQFAQVPVWSQSDCARRWSVLRRSMICAGDEGGRAVCMGDSGGPLVTQVNGRYRLIGVVSFGNPCAVPGFPDVYARVTEALPWIAANTADVATCTP